MVPYGYNNADRSDPRWYENQPNQINKTTATVWALHLNIDADDLDNVLAVVARTPEATGEYHWGDSWDEWGEDSANPDHLVIYFESVLPVARETGAAICVLVGAKSNFDVSTAGDWAEIVLS